MRLPFWYAAKLKLLLLGLLLILCSIPLFLLYKDTAPSEADIVRAIRLTTHPIMYKLEQQSEMLTSKNDRSNALQELVDEWLGQVGRDKIQLQISLLDGTIVYDNQTLVQNKTEQKSSLRIQPLLELDYGLRVSDDSLYPYHLALPLLSLSTQEMMGYAQFSFSSDIVVPLLPTSQQWDLVIAWLLVALGSIQIVYVALFAGRKLQRDYTEPITELKRYAEAILQGDYEQKAEWDRVDEVGALYAVFDQMRVEIRDLNRKQLAQSQSHKELVSNLSHDLKTPLATVKAYMEAMLAGLATDAASRENYLQIVLAHLNKMNVLLDDLLFHELRGLAQLSVHPKEQYSQAVFVPILEDMAHYIRTMGVRCELIAHVPNVLICVDSVRIEQVISNLVTNALKHTKQGDTIALSISEANDATVLEITVSDTGSGISPADMPFIFERSYQGTPSSQSGNHSDLQTGVGLGLSICKQIVDAHDGSISFSSREREGTTFKVSLPIS